MRKPHDKAMQRALSKQPPLVLSEEMEYIAGVLAVAGIQKPRAFASLLVT